MTSTTEKPISLSRNNSSASGKLTMPNATSSDVTRQYRRGRSPTRAKIALRCAGATRRTSRDRKTRATLSTAGTTATHSSGAI